MSRERGVTSLARPTALWLRLSFSPRLRGTLVCKPLPYTTAAKQPRLKLYSHRFLYLHDFLRRSRVVTVDACTTAVREKGLT